jgi:hypothetical protein
MNYNQKEYSKLIYSNEILDEQTIYSNKVKRQEFCIFSDPQLGRNFEKDPYIKVYNNKNKEDAIELVRVSMKTGAPLSNEHTNRDRDAGKKRLKFTKAVAEFLQNAMLDTPNRYTYPSYANVKTVYDGIYYDIFRLCGKCTKYPIPNFMENIE